MDAGLPPRKEEAMDRFEREDVDALDALIRRMDANVGVAGIDYGRERVSLYRVYNRGKCNEFRDGGFCEVDVSCESVPCAMWEVVNAVFHKCVL